MVWKVISLGIISSLIYLLGCKGNDNFKTNMSKTSVNENDSLKAKNISDSLSFTFSIKDTTNTTFLLYKLGDPRNVVDEKTKLLRRNSKIFYKGTENELYYMLPSFSNSNSTEFSITDNNGNLIENSGSTEARLNFYYYNNKLHRIELYFETLPIEKFHLYKNNQALYRGLIRSSSNGLMSIYKSKYRINRWQSVINELGYVDYLYNENNLLIRIQEGLLSNSVFYMDNILEKQKSQEQQKKDKDKIEKLKHDI